MGRINAEAIQEILPTPDPEELKRVGARFELDGLRTYFSIGLTKMQEDYENNSNLDNKAHDMQITVERQLSRRFVLGANIGTLHRDFVVRGKVTDKISTVKLDRKMGENLLLSFRVETAGREAGADAFDRLFYEIRFAYSRGGKPAPGGGL